MKSDQKVEVANPSERAKSLTKVLGESEHVNELMKESADELSAVNSVLKQQIAEKGLPRGVENALEKSEAVEGKVQEASEKLTGVNRALEGEVRERDVVEHQLAAAIEQEEASRHDRLEHGIAQANRQGWTLAVLFIDLDKFKTVNDTHGHDAGDAVLQTMAQRLKENARDDDTVSRHGGDEFLYLLTNIPDEKDIVMIAEKIIAAIQVPCKVNIRDGEINSTIGASIGIAIFPKHGATGNALIKSADEAMYRAKKSKSRYSFAL